MDELTKVLLPEAIGGAAGQAPLLLILVYFLRSIQVWMPKVDKRLEEMGAAHQALAVKFSETTTIQAMTLATTREQLAELKTETRAEIKELRATMTLHTSQLDAVWRKIGDRPQDRPA